VVGAVTRRVDAGVGRLAALIHHDTVLAADSCCGSKTDVGQDADADDHQVGREFLVTAGHGTYSAIAQESGHRGVAVDAHAFAFVAPRVEL
jgi:hypothetical protein